MEAAGGIAGIDNPDKLTAFVGALQIEFPDTGQDDLAGVLAVKLKGNIGCFAALVQGDLFRFLCGDAFCGGDVGHLGFYAAAQREHVSTRIRDDLDGTAADRCVCIHLLENKVFVAERVRDFTPWGEFGVGIGADQVPLMALTTCAASSASFMGRGLQVPSTSVTRPL